MASRLSPLRIVAMAILWLLMATLHAETQRIKVRFEVDGKPTVGPLAIEFYNAAGRRIAREDITDHAFNMPHVGSGDTVDVRLRLAGRRLIFRGIHASKLVGSWIVGIDRPPFNEENASSVPQDSKPKELWVIQFDPPDGDGTRMVVAIGDPINRR